MRKTTGHRRSVLVGTSGSFFLEQRNADKGQGTRDQGGRLVEERKDALKKERERERESSGSSYSKVQYRGTRTDTRAKRE